MSVGYIRYTGNGMGYNMVWARDTVLCCGRMRCECGIRYSRMGYNMGVEDGMGAGYGVAEGYDIGGIGAGCGIGARCGMGVGCGMRDEA